MGDPNQVVAAAAQCAVAKERDDETVKATEIAVQTQKVAPEPESEPASEVEEGKVAIPAASEDPVTEPAVQDPAAEIVTETLQDTGKEEVPKVNEIIEKINGVGIIKEEPAEENVAAEAEPAKIEALAP